MKRRDALLGLLTSLSLPVLTPSRAVAHPPGAPPGGYSSTAILLKNRARLVVVEIPDASVVAIDILFTVGLADEGRYAGVNAVITRAWGGDTENRSGTLLQRDISGAGAIGTAQAEDWVGLWGLSAPGEQALKEMGLSLFTNIVANSIFPLEVLNRAKDEVKAAHLLARDDLRADTLERLRGRIFARSPYGLSLYGTETSLATLTPETVKEYYDRHFRPERCVVAVAGPLKADRVKQLIDSWMEAGGWNDRPAAPSLPDIGLESLPDGLRDLVLPRQAPGSVVALGWLAPGTASTDSRSTYAALLVLDAVLSGGKSSRFFTLLRDGQSGEPVLAYDIESQVVGRRRQSTLYAVATGVEKPKECQEALLRVCTDLATGTKPITADELQRAKIYLMARHERERQRARSRSFGAAWCEALGLGGDFDTTFDVRIDAVTLGAVNTLATRLFNEPCATAYTSR